MLHRNKAGALQALHSTQVLNSRKVTIMNAQYSQWLEMNRAAMSPILRWNELATQTAQKLARQGLTLAQDVVELGARQLQLMGELKDPQRWALEESKLLAEYGQKFVGRAGDYLSMSNEVRESVVNWTEDTAKTAADAINPKAS